MNKRKLYFGNSRIKMILLLVSIVIPLSSYAQIKYTTEAQEYSLSKLFEAVDSTSTSKFIVKRKKWKGKKSSIKKVKKNKLTIHQFKNKTIETISRFIISNDSLHFKNIAHYDGLGNLIKMEDINEKLLGGQLNIIYKYNDHKNIDSIFYFRDSTCFQKKAIDYISKDKKKSELLHTFSSKKGYLQTYIQYEYSNNRVSKKSYFQNNKKQPIAEIVYKYNNSGLLISTTNKYPTMAFPKMVQYEYDEHSNICKETINFGKYGKDSYEYVYEYDKFKNWVYQIVILNGRIEEVHEREVNYKE